MICSTCERDCNGWCDKFPHLSKRGLQSDGTSRLPLLARLEEWEQQLEECSDMCDIAVDHQTLLQTKDAIKRFLELTEPLEGAVRSHMSDRDLDYLQLRHELLGKEA